MSFYLFTLSSFPVIHKVVNVGIFVFLFFNISKIEKSVTSIYEFKAPWQILIIIDIDSVLNCFQFISIRTCTKMAMLPTLCITGKLVRQGQGRIFYQKDHQISRF